MRAQPAPQENPAASVTPTIHFRAPWRVESLEVLGDFALRVRFVDGVEGKVRMQRLISSPGAGVFAALADAAVFAKAHVEHGAVTWPGEIDLAPDAMHAAIKAHGVWQP